MERLVILMVLTLYGIGYLIYKLYGKQEPSQKFYDHYWID
jgi:hypothetical protein